MRILIAEDDAFSRRLLERTLAKWGYEAVAAADGLSALERLTGDDAPELAIVDWMMPGLDGLELCRRLRRAQGDSDRPAYVIMLTARMSAEGLAEAVEAGADDYATKSFDLLELRVRLRAGERIVRLRRRLGAAGGCQGECGEARTCASGR